ncbi:hypothetical protein PMAYCL1PPCAC_03526, partial [Pristionchus mayeri]
QSPICPRTPVEGEPTARLYMIGVILANGTHHIYDNDPASRIRWDASLSTYFFVYEYGTMHFEEEIFAATCAYQ